MSNVDEGVKGKLLCRFSSRALKAFVDDEMFDDTSRKWTESAAKDLEEHQEKKINRWRLKNGKRKEKG